MSLSLSLSLSNTHTHTHTHTLTHTHTHTRAIPHLHVWEVFVYGSHNTHTHNSASLTHIHTHAASHLDVREVFIHSPHGSVVGPWCVQCNDCTRGPLSAHQVQHSGGTSVTEVDWQVLTLCTRTRTYTCRTLSHMHVDSLSRHRAPVRTLSFQTVRVCTGSRELRTNYMCVLAYMCWYIRTYKDARTCRRTQNGT